VNESEVIQQHAASYRELAVWQKAMDLAGEVYRLTASFPADERFRLIDQLTRAAVSVPANVAEGSGRGTPRDNAGFISIAKGSANEVETYLLLSIRLGYVDKADASPALHLVDEVSRMLTMLRRRLRST
jgi:four helix bundle protein